MWLDDHQLDYLCEGISREQKARRCKFLRTLGLNVIVTPSGAPRVLCSNVEAVLGGVPAKDQKKTPPAEAQPDRAALVAHFGKRKKAA